MSKSVTHRHTRRTPVPDLSLAEITEAARALAAESPPIELELDIHVKVVRVRRRRCPRCQRVRVLFRLSAFGSSPIGDGPLLCGKCGGLR
jgi:ribosomal protein S27AE